MNATRYMILHARSSLTSLSESVKGLGYQLSCRDLLSWEESLSVELCLAQPGQLLSQRSIV